mmetsp:Transcript_5141/g.10373  ORF Transcript_5141/g.10373 Transcript_5141/m.10373 type:complete len:282 (+) Transcript_5141:1014-1859(+)
MPKTLHVQVCMDGLVITGNCVLKLISFSQIYFSSIFACSFYGCFFLNLAHTFFRLINLLETRHRDRSYSNPEGFEKFSNLYATASSFNPSLSTIDCDGEDVEMDGSEDQIQTKSDSELLRNTRSRILEDLDEERASRGGKGVVTLPHMLAKYSQIYNKGGRVGIYTPAERTAIIAKFRSKRSRRVWNKKIRYNCRKNLADRRLRVKGRFVKRTEVEGLLSTRSGEENCSSPPPPAIPVSEASSASEEDCQESELPDTMPDEVSFEPTKEQPFRRTRRHTIA